MNTNICLHMNLTQWMDVETLKRMEIRNVTQHILERCLKYAKTIWILWRYSKNSFLHFQKSLKTTFIWLLGFMLLFIKLIYRTSARLWQYYNLKRGTLLYSNLYTSECSLEMYTFINHEARQDRIRTGWPTFCLVITRLIDTKLTE